MEGFNYM